MRQHSHFYACGIVQFVFSIVVALVFGFDAALWAMAITASAILTIGVGLLIRNKTAQPLTNREEIYFVVIGVFLITVTAFVALSGLGGFLIVLIISGFSAFVASIASRGRSGYVAHKRKGSWTRRDGTTCYRHKQSWDVSEEEVPDWISLATFFLTYFLIATPLLMFSYPFNLFLLLGFFLFLIFCFLFRLKNSD